MSTFALAIAAIVGFACGPGEGAVAGRSGVIAGRLAHVDVVVFAPHPDDEVIGAGGVLQQALERGEHVRIVFVTNGDGYPKAASVLDKKPISALGSADYIHLAATRQREAIAAAAMLGVSSSSLVFLGYPDAVLEQVYAANDVAVRSVYTGKSSTYGPVATDFHTHAHGRPAPYTRAGALADVEEVLGASGAARVYVTAGADQHPDHRTTFNFVRDAIDAVGSGAKVFMYDVHGGLHWPWPPGPTPRLPLESHVVDGATYPIGLEWPPPVRVPLTAHESAIKLQALGAHRSQWTVDRAYLESFVKSEEVFWTTASRWSIAVRTAPLGGPTPGFARLS